tara:strand:- start:2994 stop:4250 length:1257 start_codon:yes stop_codon:yes gene_type:complete
MAEFTIDVGKIKLTWQGLWSNSTAYTTDDLVHYDDGSTISAYIAVADNTNQIPSVTGTVDTANWNLFASGGLAGGLQPGGTGSNQIQWKNGLALAGEAAFTYDDTSDILNVPNINVTGTAHTPTVDVNGSVTATSFFEGANQLTYNIAATQVTSAQLDNARLPNDISVTNLAATTGLNIKTGGLIFDDTTDRVGINASAPATALDVRTIAQDADIVVGRFRADHTTAKGTYIEVHPNTAQAQLSGVHLHKNSLRTEPFTIQNDGGAVTLINNDSTSPSIDLKLGSNSELLIEPTLATLNNPLRINGSFDEAVTNVAISGSNVLDIDATVASVFTVALDANITTFNITLPTGSRSVTLTFIFTAATSTQYTINWPANTKWPGGSGPTMVSTQNASDVISLSTVSGGSSWFGFVGGQEFT